MVGCSSTAYRNAALLPLFFSLLIIHAVVDGPTGAWSFRLCDRTPEGTAAHKTAADDRFLIEVSGNPVTYVPGEQYTLFLRSNPDHKVQHKFKDFTLVVEHEQSERTVGGQSQNPQVGSLQLYGDMLTKFSEKCRNSVTQTNSMPKAEVQVLWLAPAAGSGCVAIRATVIESKDVWFSDDGKLTKVLCEETQDSEDAQPGVMRHCCACDEAKYEVTFEGLWSRNTHPKDFPSNGWLTRFSDIIGASHTVDYTFWNYGDIASEGLRQLAENGNTRMLESELKAKSDHIRTIIKARGISYPNITGKTFAVFRVDSRHHLMSLVSMIDPSPDWIVGVSSLELCLRNCSWVESRVLNLYPWDAGTDDGPTYISPNQPSNPRDPIRRIKSNSPNDPRSPFYDASGGEMKPLARLYLSRQRLYEKTCDPSQSEGDMDYLEATNENCEVDEWSDWSPCSATCGKGVKYKQRGYKNEESKYHCTKVLTQRAPCYGIQRHCRNQPHSQEHDPHCALTDWGEWSSCTVTCGRGWKTRSRRYRNRSAAKRCATRTENPQLLEQNIECFEGECPHGGGGGEVPEECEGKAWTSWSPCSATCGKGIKVRRRVPAYSYSRYKRGIFDAEETDEDGTEEDVDAAEDGCPQEERVECINDENPACDENEVLDPAIACKLPRDEGRCRSNVDRWYFDIIKGTCDIFSFSGCQGNRNNFKTLERCESICGEFKKELIANRTAQKRKLGVSVSGVLSYNIMHLQNAESANCTALVAHYATVRANNELNRAFITDHSVSGIPSESQTFIKSHQRGGGGGDGNIIEQSPSGQVVHCDVSHWSKWSPCNVTCGNGFKTKYRTIKMHPSNGGTKCPEKLIKKHRCTVRCNGESAYGDLDELQPTWGPPGPISNVKVDCVMSKWSAWSPCSRSCGPNAVQQRTRSILMQASGRGQPCLHRTEERSCALLACPE